MESSNYTHSHHSCSSLTCFRSSQTAYFSPLGHLVHTYFCICAGQATTNLKVQINICLSMYSCLIRHFIKHNRGVGGFTSQSSEFCLFKAPHDFCWYICGSRQMLSCDSVQSKQTIGLELSLMQMNYSLTPRPRRLNKPQ